MKKLLAFLLAASVAGSVFALDLGNGLTVTGAVKTGVRLWGQSQDDNPEYDAGKGTAILYPWNDDAGHPFRAEVTFKYDNGDSGFTFRHRGQIGAATNGSLVFLVPFAYGWIGLAGNKVQLSGGILDNKKWGTMDGFDLDTGFDNDGALKLEFKPIDGLSFGLNTFHIWPKDTTGVAWDTLVDMHPLWATVLGARYTSGLIDATIEGRVNKKDGDHFYAGKDDKFFDLLAYAKLTAISNLPILFDLRTTTMKPDGDGATDTSEFQTALQPGFQINDQLKADLRIRFKDQESKVKSDGEGNWQLEFRPKLEYKINNNLTANAEIGLEFADNRYGLGDLKDRYDDWKGGFNLEIKPKLTYDFKNGAKIVTFYDFLSQKTGYYDVSGSSEPKPLVTHQIQLDLIWSF